MRYILSAFLEDTQYFSPSVREISADIAKQVIRDAQRAVRLSSPTVIFNTSEFAKQGVDRSIELRSMNDTQLIAYIMRKMWNP